MEKKRRLTFISRSDLRGGAAVVTYRLVVALREIGVDARMLVCEKLSNSDFVRVCAPFRKMQYVFYKERLEVYLHNGFSRENLFKVDPALEGLPLYEHPWVKEADAIFLGWVNQGMLSLKGVRRICVLGKPVVWIMHDMWNMTGICHHAGGCTGFLRECGDCPLLGKKANDEDMSHQIWELKSQLYGGGKIRFVAVSTWLSHRAMESKLMGDIHVSVIPNPFLIESEDDVDDKDPIKDRRIRIIFGAARLDDPIKGLPVLKRALESLRSSYPDVAENVELVTFGGFKHLDSLRGFAVPHVHLGVLRGSDEIRNAYKSCDIVVSTSDFETLPGTLVEGQAYGCIPVALDHGGQRDVVEHLSTGWLAPWNDSIPIRGGMIAEGIVWAYRHAGDPDIKRRMRESVEKRFSAHQVARRFLEFTFSE